LKRGAAPIAAALALLGAPTAASPFDEIRAGVLIQGLGPFSPNKEDGVAINSELVFDSIADFGAHGSLRPNLGLSLATGEFATSSIYGGLLWRIGLSRRFFFDAGFGLAIHDGETSFTPPDPLINERNYLGCRALVRLSADLGYRLTDRLSAMIHVDHVSNAGLCSENEGLDNTGFRLGYSL
jgi:lipid A 3-O-deacylase